MVKQRNKRRCEALADQLAAAGLTAEAREEAQEEARRKLMERLGGMHARLVLPAFESFVSGLEARIDAQGGPLLEKVLGHVEAVGPDIWEQARCDHNQRLSAEAAPLGVEDMSVAELLACIF